MGYASATDGARAKNNFSSLRLIFASAVIFSHSPFILSGDSALEPHFGKVTLGSLAVDGFFLVSGYLITKSFDRDNNIPSYFSKRILRIYPAFLVNMAVGVLLLAPLIAGHYHVSRDWPVRLLLLAWPRINGGLEGMPAPGLNGSIWTLAYEFRCYILVVFLGMAGFGKLRTAIALAAVVLLAATALPLPEASGWVYQPLGSPPNIARLFGMFAAGMSFYLWRGSIPYRHGLAALAAVVLLLSTMAPVGVENLAIALAGGYLVFWAALRLPGLALSRFGDKTDLSYGIYLYAWPVQLTIAYALHRQIAPIELSIVALPIAAGLAFLSWNAIEKPAMAIANRRIRTTPALGLSAQM